MATSSVTTMTCDINRMVAAGTPKADIMAEMTARAAREQDEARRAGFGASRIPQLLLKAALRQALPLDAKEARGRRLKAERQAEMARRPEGILARAGKTRAQLRYELLKEMKRRTETGLAFSCRGFLPYSPHGERLVRAGFARLARSGSARSQHSMLHITPEGEKELARLEKRHGA